MQEIYEIPEIGKVTFVRSKRVKRVSISIKPIVGVKITRPMYVSKKKAYEFLMLKKDWILSHKEKMKALEDNYTIFDLNTSFNTLKRELIIIPWDKSSFRGSITDDKIIFKFPKEEHIHDPIIQKRIRKLIEKAWKIEAEDLLIPLTFKLADNHSFKVNEVVIKNVVSKWGSCSYRNDIVLSLHMMRLPDHLIEYIVLHELCHTKEKNHQASFWNLMDTVTNGKAKSLDKELKSYSTKIY